MQRCLCLQLTVAAVCLSIGGLITACVCGLCCIVVKFAVGFAKGDKNPDEEKQERPQNAVIAKLYDVSAKYGGFIPGGAGLTAGGGAQAHLASPGDGKPPPPQSSGPNSPVPAYTPVEPAVPPGFAPPPGYRAAPPPDGVAYPPPAGYPTV